MRQRECEVCYKISSAPARKQMRKNQRNKQIKKAGKIQKKHDFFVSIITVNRIQRKILG